MHIFTSVYNHNIHNFFLSKYFFSSHKSSGPHSSSTHNHTHQHFIKIRAETNVYNYTADERMKRVYNKDAHMC